MSAENKKPDDTKTSVIEEVPQVKPSFSTERASNVFKDVSKLVGGAEAVQVAQAKIIELEKERDALRTELDKIKIQNEEYQRHVLKVQDQLDTSNKKHRDKIEILEDEKTILRQRAEAKEKETELLNKKIEELEWRFENDLQKVRVKEREYENKNIILKAESQAVNKNKDEIILNLKAQVDQLQFELQQFKNRLKQSDRSYKELEERQSRALKAMRISVGVLESDLTETKIKKVSGDD